MHKFLPFIIIIVAVIGIILYFITPFRAFVAYNFHLVPESFTSCCKVEDILTSNGSFDENASMAIFNNEIIDYPKTSLAQAMNQNIAQIQTDGKNVLGTNNSTGEEKWIEVTLAEQKLRAWEGNKVVMEFPISSGLWNSTNRGTFNIWYKTRNQRMVGGSKELGTYYDLPNVPNNMFYDGGRALHGAYWHNNFGHVMSHGCINEPLASAAQIFEWAGPVLPPGQGAIRATPNNPGTRVVVR
jgi:lipoprotein-anchoring transpeptidase ErfK/SrfK